MEKGNVVQLKRVFVEGILKDQAFANRELSQKLYVVEETRQKVGKIEVILEGAPKTWFNAEVFEIMAAKQFEHVMLDLETLGTEPGCVVLQIGAVEFDLFTGETGRTYKADISIKSCLDAGLTIDPDTMCWWMQQSDEAKALFDQEGKITLWDALDGFNKFYKAEQRIWGNSNRFDLGILEAAYKMTRHEKTPWKHTSERDVRTIADLVPEIKKNHVFVGVKHDTISDALNQIAYCHNTLQEFRKQTVN